MARILGDGRRQRTRALTELQSHYLFEDRFGRPGKGNDKGKVEGQVGYTRRNFLLPVPSFESFDALNAYLERRCLERMDARLRGHTETIGQRMERDLEALLPLPLAAYDARETQAGRVSSLSLVRYRTNDYSVPVAYGHCGNTGSLGQCYSRTSGHSERWWVGLLSGYRGRVITSFAPSRARCGESRSR